MLSRRYLPRKGISVFTKSDTGVTDANVFLCLFPVA